MFPGALANLGGDRSEVPEKEGSEGSLARGREAGFPFLGTLGLPLVSQVGLEEGCVLLLCLFQKCFFVLGVFWKQPSIRI